MVDVIIICFLIAAVVAGMLSGGFRELIKLIILITFIIIFSLPSVREGLRGMGGSMGNMLFITAFVGGYLIASWLGIWVLKGLVEEREGVLGGFNRGIGAIAGLAKGWIVVLFAVNIIGWMWSKKLLTEWKGDFDNSAFIAAARSMLAFISG